MYVKIPVLYVYGGCMYVKIPVLYVYGGCMYVKIPVLYALHLGRHTSSGSSTTRRRSH